MSCHEPVGRDVMGCEYSDKMVIIGVLGGDSAACRAGLQSV